MSGPADATINGDGFRMYRWAGGDSEVNRAYNAVEPSDLLSVTSIRSLCGEDFRLVNWKISNVVNLAMGVRKAVRIGPRGGVKQVYVPDGPHPGEFVARMLETRGRQEPLDELRSWLRSTADEPRDIAAVRGSVVHGMIEMGLTVDIATDPDIIGQRMRAQWSEEKRRQAIALTDDDINFVGNAMRQYWAMREAVPFVILAQEPQVFNLTVGYAGSADVLLWFLGNWVRDEEGKVRFEPLPKVGPAEVAALQKRASKGQVTVEDVRTVGGQVAVGDWKTSADVYTSHVVQTTAYMAAEFVARGGVIDTRLSDLFDQALLGMVIHIRPDHWSVDLFEMRQDVLRAFVGSVALARFIAMHKRPDDLFVYRSSGKADGTEESSNATGD